MSDIFKAVTDSETVLTELMIPSYANFSGKVHGGILLSLMDKVAYVCACKHSSSYCVTVAVEGVEFLSPVEVGDLVTIKAMVNYVGNTTMIVGMRVESFKPKNGITRHTNSCYFTMAAKDDDGNLCTVPSLVLQNETELRRFCEGRLIRKLSKEKRDLLKSNLSTFSNTDLIKELKEERCVVKFVH